MLTVDDPGIELTTVRGGSMISDVSRQTYPFSLPELPYPYDALEPHIDRKTLELHHRQHHQAYVTKLNDALAKEPALHATTLADLLRDPTKLPEAMRSAVKNNGGGHLNHDFFWNAMAPATARAAPTARPAREPGGELAAAIKSTFGSFEEFRDEFSDAATKHFASGWVARSVDPKAQALGIADLEDHETLLPRGHVGLLILDVWEHAYYLKYQNRRPEFIEAFWNVANWAAAEARYGQRLGRT
jgi:Fe-Mn family superoxide dismutase